MPRLVCGCLRQFPMTSGVNLCFHMQIGFKRISEAYSVLRDPEKRAECAKYTCDKSSRANTIQVLDLTAGTIEVVALDHMLLVFQDNVAFHARRNCCPFRSATRRQSNCGDNSHRKMGFRQGLFECCLMR